MVAKLKNKIAIALALVITILIAEFSLFAPVEVNAAKSINGHNYVTENDRYVLYMNEDYLSIIVEDKVTGAYMESAMSYDDGKNNKTWIGAMQSALVLTAVYSSVDTQQVDLINDECTKKITYTDNGFTAEIFWKKYQFGMTLEVSLEDDGVVARVPDESIVEKTNQYYIGTISIYPYLGHSYLDSKAGYMFLPDGNGALIYLDNKEARFSSGYSSMIYGDDVGFIDSEVTSLLWGKYEMVNDPNKILAPVFGMAHTDEGIAFLAVVEEGAERATIEAQPNGVNIDYNRIYAKFIERKLYTQPLGNDSSSGTIKLTEEDRSHSDLQIRYLFLSEENANYAGMANAYRNYLLDKGALTVKDTSYNTRIDFLGTEREDWLIGTSSVVMTTVDDIYGIYDDLESANVTDIISVYKGWQKGGLYDIPITKYKADGDIGGTDDLTKLIKDSQERGISLYLYNNALKINPDEQNATFNVVKRINKRKLTEKTYKDVYEEFNYLTPARSKTLVNKFVDSYLKKKVSNLAIAGITNNVFSYSYGGDFYTRYNCADSYKSLIEQIDGKTNLVLEQPYAYLWEYADAYLDMPLYTSDYIYEDESVPFMSIVLKGVIPVYADYINFEANKHEFFLRMVESGSFPSFYITKESSSDLIYTNSNDIYSSEYDVYRDTIIEYSTELKEISEKTEGAYIIGHEIFDSQIRKVTYDNGVVIYINYARTGQSADGYTIDAMSYKVVE